MEAVPVQTVSTTQVLPAPLKQLAQTYLSNVNEARGFPTPDLPCWDDLYSWFVKTSLCKFYNNFGETQWIVAQTWGSSSKCQHLMTWLIFHLFVCELDRITMQVLMLMLQEASGSNQCYIKSRRERGSSVKQEEDALRWQLKGNCIDFQLATSTAKLMYTEQCVLCIRDGNGSSKAHITSLLTWESA